MDFCYWLDHNPFIVFTFVDEGFSISRRTLCLFVFVRQTKQKQSKFLTITIYIFFISI